MLKKKKKIDLKKSSINSLKNIEYNKNNHVKCSFFAKKRPFSAFQKEFFLLSEIQLRPHLFGKKVFVGLLSDVDK